MDKKVYDESTVKFLNERFNWDIYFKDREKNPFTLRVNFYGTVQECLDWAREFCEIKHLRLLHISQWSRERGSGRGDRSKPYSSNLEKRIQGKERQGIPLKEKAFWSQRRRQ